ncbi:MAG: alpha-L-fucosidase [Phycisphaeraceae bacterium]|nr:alpha-L-fucosidase [Phycisphaeraceae bacterium]
MSEVDALSWWREVRFGMFIHWGLYSVLAGKWRGEPVPGIGEWIMYTARIKLDDYAPLAGQFNPTKFDADAWVKMASDAGMKYLVITAKHHDGFAMFDSAHPYNIVKTTPWAKDPMVPLAQACHRYGVKLCFYYSQDLDWEAPGGSHKWEEGNVDGKFTPVEPERFAQYIEDKVKPQLTELLTKYGPVGLIWFDVPASISREQSMDLRNFVHMLQPDCLVSGRVGHDCGDYGSLGDNQIPQGKVQGDWETPATLNDTWGFKQDDHNWKSVEYLVRLLVQCASRGVNSLLNIGPTAEGDVPRPTIERFQAIGRWMKVNGESIYGTRQNPFPCDFPWGRVTCKRGRLYLHFFTWPGRDFTLAGLRSTVLGARLLADGREIITFRQEHDAATDSHLLRVTLPDAAPDSCVSVLALDLAGEPDVDPLPVQQPDGGINLPAWMAQREGNAEIKLDTAGYTTGWESPTGHMRWSFRLRQPGRYRVYIQNYLDRESELNVREKEGRSLFGDHAMRVSLLGEQVAGLTGCKDMIMDESVNRWHTAESDLGVIRIDKSGELSLTLAMEQRDAKSVYGPAICGVRLRREP